MFVSIEHSRRHGLNTGGFPFHPVVTFLLVLTVLGVTGAPGDEISHVSFDDPVYYFLQRMAVLGNLKGFDASMRPMKRGAIMGALEELYGMKRMGKLSLGDEAVLMKMLRRFSPDTDRFRGSYGAPKRSLLELDQEDLELYGELFLGGKGMVADDDTGEEWRYSLSLGADFRGCVPGRNLAFTGSALDTREENCPSPGERDRAPGEEMVLYHDSHCYTDRAVASVTYFDSPIEITLAKETLRWGPAYHENLGLSAQAGSFPLVAIRLDWERVSFMEILGVLRSLEPDTLRSYYIASGRQRKLERPKYISSHRLVLRATPHLRFSFYESVIYGDRPVELVYLVPPLFLWSAEHYLGDRDNYSFGVDVEVDLTPGIRWYGSLFVDEIFLAKMFNDRERRNVIAALTGCWLANPFGLNDIDVHAEVMLAAPWIYRHKYAVSTYEHNGFTLGHSDGENACHSYLDIDYLLRSDLRIGLSVEYALKGRVWEIEEYLTVPAERILEGSLTEKRSVGFRLRYDPDWNIDLHAALGYCFERWDYPEEPVKTRHSAEFSMAWSI